MNNSDKFQQAMEALEKARQMQRDRLRFGLDFVNLYVEDVEGDWLENWGEEIPDVLTKTWFDTTKWLQGIFTQGWQAVNSLLNESELNLAYNLRSKENPKEENQASAAKLIDLGLELANKSVVLLIALIPKAEDNIDVYLELHPSGKDKFLPPDLTLILLDENFEVQGSVKSRSFDNYIKLQFQANQSDRFVVKVSLGDVNVTEYLVI
jgi:hypothetical protein